MKNRIISCVQPGGDFLYGIHKPQFTVANLRQAKETTILGELDGTPVDNSANFPDGDIAVQSANWVYEIPNPLPFRGRTFINKEWADASAQNRERIHLPQPEKVSFTETLQKMPGHDSMQVIAALPAPLQLALATTSTDNRDLTALASISCELLVRQDAIQLQYHNSGGQKRPVIHNHQLFEAVANNPHLPDKYKIAMVIRPGAQGASEIVGEWKHLSPESHIYEYLRRNSYIAGGHYAANMAEDAIRYNVQDLGAMDISGLRRLYYQRSFVRLAMELKIKVPQTQQTLSKKELEQLRLQICHKIEAGEKPHLSATLWGWNFGFDYASSGYRLHASHQQVHQQYAMLPETIDPYSEGCDNSDGGMPSLPSYGCGDFVAAVIEEYAATHDSDFFTDYRRAIFNNKRMDNFAGESSLIVWQDEHSLLFVPKAQTSQWELQLMTLPTTEGKLPGNIVECNSAQRNSLDKAILIAQKTLAKLGAKMVTSIEYSKRIGSTLPQPLLYSLLPRLPESPGAFSEAQLRFINGHYPEDFAATCREAMEP